MDFHKILIVFVSALLLNSPVLAVDGWASMNGGTTGGQGGTTVTVTTPADFKTYVESTSTYIVQVAADLDLVSIGGKVNIKSNKTIKGIGWNTTIRGKLGFEDYSSNIIIENLTITNPNYTTEYDGMSVKNNITNLFVTKCTFFDCGDGCLDITNESDFITVSWCRFYYINQTSHRYANLIGHSDSYSADNGHLRVTMHHNWWYTLCDERMPRVRFGQVHLYNNYYNSNPYSGYCIGVGDNCHIRVEDNYFDNVNDPWKNYSDVSNPGEIGWNSGNIFSGCSVPTWAPNRYTTIFVPPYSYTLNDANDVPAIVMAGAGCQNPVQTQLPTETDWIRRFGGSANNWDSAEDIALDSEGNIYVTGYAKNTATNYDFVTIKYAPDGNVDWIQPYDHGTLNPDYAAAITLDANSNVIVAGYGYNTTTGCDGIVVKYDNSGSWLWSDSYHGFTGEDKFYDVAADAYGNIYAAGQKGMDALLIKYAPDGSRLWVKLYNGPRNGWDVFNKVVIDDSNNIYVCGESSGIGTDQDCLIIKYSPSGSRLWVRIYNGIANGWDSFEAIAIDSAGNICVTGCVETFTDSNYITFKYDPDGNILWSASYTGTATGWDEAYAIAVDPNDNVVVTGSSEGVGCSEDAATVKYDSQTGMQLWDVRYNGLGNSTDYGNAVVTDYLGNVYIHGTSSELISENYLTICYDSNGTQQWLMNYDGPASLTDTGTAMAFDDGIVYVTGLSTSTDGNYATIRYDQHYYCTESYGEATPGDLNGDCRVDLEDLNVLTDQWLQAPGIPSADIAPLPDGDGIINFFDFLSLADTWLDCGFLIPEDCSIIYDTNSPQNLMVPPMAYDDTQVILIWEKPDDYSQVTDYKVYQDGLALGLSGRFDTTRPRLHYTVTGLEPNTTYNFTVKSVFGDGSKSVASNVCTVTTADTPAVFYPEDFGAVADGVTKDTAAIQAAIDACIDGGKVHLQAGKTFLSGAIFVKSNMTLQIDGTLLGSSDPTDYPATSLRFPYYFTGNNYMGLVNAYYDYLNPASAGQPYGSITNVRICGSGVINGCEGYSASNPNTVTGHDLTLLGIIEAAIYGDSSRGDMVTIKGVNQVYLGGWGGTLTLVYPAMHTIFISYCNGVTVADVNCDTFDIHNGDGINLCTSDTAYIFNSRFDTGDDCINMNAGQGLEGVNEGYPDQNIRVFDCITERGHGGYVIGSFTAAWVQDSLIEDCLFQNNDPYSNGYGIRMKTGYNNGGGGRRITCRDIRISGTAREGIHLYSNYPATGYTDAGPGQFSGNIFKNITVNPASPSRASIYISGLLGTPHTQNTFENITGSTAAYLNYCTDSNFIDVDVTSWTIGSGCTGNTSSGCPGCPF